MQYHGQSVAACAELYRARGLSLCRPSPGGKAPKDPGWTTRSLDAADFAEGDLVGIMSGPLSDGGQLGCSLVIVDIDSASALGLADDILPPTEMIEGRPSKQRSHRYYLTPNSSIPPEEISTAEQSSAAALEVAGHRGPRIRHYLDADRKGVVDVLGTGAQAVAPPSGHPSGELREWVGGEPGAPAIVDYPVLLAAVEELASRCGWKRPPPPAPAPPPSTAGPERNGRGMPIWDRAIAYLAHCPPAVSGKGGHATAFAVARAIVLGFDLGPESGYELLVGYWNDRCDPPWSEAELRHKCRDAAERPYSKPRGWLLAQDSPRWRCEDDMPPRDETPWPTTDEVGGECANGQTAENGQLVGGNGGNGNLDPPTRPGPPLMPDFKATDYGNAERLVWRFGSDFRHCHPWQKTLIWSGKHWAHDETGGLVRLAKRVVRGIYREAADHPDDQRREALGKHALRCEAAARISAMIDLAKSESKIHILPEALDKDPWALNCSNGTVDLRTGELKPHRRGDYITRLCEVPYDPAAPCPRWTDFLTEIFDDDVALIQYVQRLIGYFLTGTIREHVLPIFWGSGANGKSTLLGTISTLLGPYACRATSEILLARRGPGESHPTERANLFGRRLVVASETDDGRRISESAVKDLSGGDKIVARRMREDFWEFKPTHKVVLATNHKPVITGTDVAIWRRVQLVPFEVTIPPERMDHQLPQKLEAELPGVLAWAVLGCKEWQRIGLSPPEAVTEATKEYRSSSDVLGEYLTECCVVVQGDSQLRVRASALYESYRLWCERNGEHAVNQRRFGQAIAEKGFTKIRNDGFWYSGVALKDNGNTV